MKGDISQCESSKPKYWAMVWVHRHQTVSTSDRNILNRPDQTSKTSFSILTCSQGLPWHSDEQHYPHGIIISEILSLKFSLSYLQRYLRSVCKNCVEMKLAHHQWPLAGLWLWRCQQYWGPGSCSIPCQSARHQWWSDPRSGILRIGWRVEEVGRRKEDSGGDKRILWMSLQVLTCTSELRGKTFTGTCFVYLTAFSLPKNSWLWVSSGLTLEGDSSADPNHLVPWSHHKCWGHWRTDMRMVGKWTDKHPKG